MTLSCFDSVHNDSFGIKVKILTTKIIFSTQAGREHVSHNRRTQQIKNNNKS